MLIHKGTLILGWLGTKVAGVFGAVGAAARLLELDAGQATHALSVAASDASGTMEYDQSGGEVKRSAYSSRVARVFCFRR